VLSEWQKFWQDSLEAVTRPPKSADELRRNYLKTMSKDELWLWHDEIIKEIRSR